jgi:glucose/arabinose dehydrogenase
MRRCFTLAICLLSLASGLNEVAGELMPPPLARPQDQSRFHATTFATGLAYPTSMTELADGSLLVATNAGGSAWLSNYIFASPSASLVRLIDADRDGVADGRAQRSTGHRADLSTAQLFHHAT